MSFVYDISEIDNIPQFVYDVKILYQLKGYRIRSFHELCSSCLSHNETEQYYRATEKVKAHVRSYIQCGIPIENYEISDIIPKEVLDKLELEKQHLIDRLFNRFVDERVFSFYDCFFPKLQCLHAVSKNLSLKFNYVGTKTGRLSFKSNTFNPYVLPKEKRSCIKARPGYKLYEYDLKCSQPRIAIFSTADDRFKNQFAGADDIYSVFPGDRATNKVSFLRWMYSQQYFADERFDAVAHPIKILRNAIFHDALHGVIHNRFGRPLYFSGESDNVVFQNYITSNEADALYEIIFQVQSQLEGTKSRILFPFFDAIVCEIKDDEQDLPIRLKNTIENNFLDHVFYCKFPVEMRKGDNFGALQ